MGVLRCVGRWMVHVGCTQGVALHGALSGWPYQAVQSTALVVWFMASAVGWRGVQRSSAHQSDSRPWKNSASWIRWFTSRAAAAWSAACTIDIDG